MLRPSRIVLRALYALVALLYGASEARSEKYHILVTDARIIAKKQLASGHQPLYVGAR